MARYDSQPFGVLRASAMEPMELSSHLIEGTVLLAGAVLELLSPTSQDP
jgi:hypothetical protein